MSPMTQASAGCGCALAAPPVADACRGDALGWMSAPTVARSRETNFQIAGVCLMKRLSWRRAVDVAPTAGAVIVEFYAGIGPFVLVGLVADGEVERRSCA